MAKKARAQKEELNRKLAARDRFDNVGRRCIYEGYINGKITDLKGDTQRQDMYVSRTIEGEPPICYATKISGKRYWVIKRGVEIYRLIPREKYRTALECVRAFMNGKEK